MTKLPGPVLTRLELIADVLDEVLVLLGEVVEDDVLVELDGLDLVVVFACWLAPLATTFLGVDVVDVELLLLKSKIIAAISPPIITK